MEAHGSLRFGHHDAAAFHPVHSVGGGAHQVIPGMNMMPFSAGGMGGAPLLAGGLVMPGMGLAAAGFGTAPKVTPAARNKVAAAAGKRRGGGRGKGGASPPHRGPWTPEEDEVLKAMVRKFGDRKWSLIAPYLPGRIGKQCRERWTNHLRPEINKNKNFWTEEDDRALIESHRTWGNRWSLIARCLPGRSENAVKNHWNATKRGLNAKRRLKKKNSQVPRGQLSTLELYIRDEADEAAAKAAARLAMCPPPPLPPVYSPPSHDAGYYGEVITPPPAAPMAAPAPDGFDMAGLAMSLNSLNNASSSSTGSSSNHLGAGDFNMPLLLGLNAAAYHGVEPPAPAPPQAMLPSSPAQQQWMAAAQEHQAGYGYGYGYSYPMSYPFLDSFAWQPSPSSYAGASAGDHYYGDAAGPSSGGGLDDVLLLATREFLTPSQDEVTLNLARFM
ncbi:hypothetical protein ACP4OV_008713 [Aristida adscensionis]